jgi:tetratricopeptide (TPR) repeat protein
MLMHAHGAQYEKSGIFEVVGVGPLDYARTQLGVILHYLKLCFWPLGLCLDYGWPVAREPRQYALPLLAMAGLLLLTAWLVVRHPRWGFLAGSFFLILAPTSSVVPIADMAFEHRMYLPLASVVTLTILAAYEIVQRLLGRLALSTGVRCAIWAVPVALVILTLGSLTWLRNEVYKTKVAIWSDTAAKSPENFRVRHNWGAALLEEEKVDEAFRQFDIMVELLMGQPPKVAIPKINEFAWMRATSPDPARRSGAAAVALAQTALRWSRSVGWREPECLDTLAAAYAEAGQFDEAVSTEEKAIALALKQNNPQVAQDGRDRLALYRAGQPFHEKLKTVSQNIVGSRKR